MALVIATASGQRTRAEQNGERDIAIWKTGVTL
jgi:altronate hydrolase